MAPFWAGLNTENKTESKIAFDVFQRYGKGANQLNKIAKIFKDSNQVGDFIPRVAIVSSWINTTFGLTASSVRKEVSYYWLYLVILLGTTILK